MVRCAACNENDASGTAHNREIATQASQSDLVVLKIDTTTHSIDDRLRLLVNLFLHEMIKGTFHDLSKFHFQNMDRSGEGFTILASEAMDVKL